MKKQTNQQGGEMTDTKKLEKLEGEIVEAIEKYIVGAKEIRENEEHYWEDFWGNALKFMEADESQKVGQFALRIKKAIKKVIGNLLLQTQLETLEMVEKSLDEEVLADLCHRQWSWWMNYLFSKFEYKDGNLVIPSWGNERWQRQINTEYKDLPELEKESDRVEARKFIKVMRQTIKNKVKSLEKT